MHFPGGLAISRLPQLSDSDAGRTYRSVWEPEWAKTATGAPFRITDEMGRAGADAVERFTELGVSPEGVARLAFQAMIKLSACLQGADRLGDSCTEDK